MSAWNRSRRAVTLWALAILCPWLHAADALAPVSIEALAAEITLRSGAEVQLSPDGNWLSYVTCDPTGGAKSEYAGQWYSFTGVPFPSASSRLEQHVTDLARGKDRKLLGGSDAAWGGTWSPDGRRLAFFSDQAGSAHLWVWDRDSGEVRQMGSTVVRPFRRSELPQWSPDGRYILCKVLPEGQTLESLRELNLDYRTKFAARTHRIASQPQAHVYRSLGGPGPDAKPEKTTDLGVQHEMTFADLACIDRESGACIRVARNVHPAWYAFSAAGDRIAYSDLVAYLPKIDAQQVFRLAVCSVQGGQEKTLVPEWLSDGGLAVSWSPKDDKLAYVTSGPAADGCCYLVKTKLEGDGPKSVALKGLSKVGAWVAPVWSRDGQKIFVIADQALWVAPLQGTSQGPFRVPQARIGSICADSRQRLWTPTQGEIAWVVANRADLVRIDLATGETVSLANMRSLATPSPDSNRVAYVALDRNHADIWIADSDFHSARQVTHLNPSLPVYPVSRSRTIEWTSLDGASLKGAMWLPANFVAGRTYPLVVFVYGGDTGSRHAGASGWQPDAQFNFEILASRGYAVLDPDIPLHVGHPMQDVFNAVMPGVDKAVELGIADPRKLAVMGQSFGGYNVLGLITQTNRFRAAIATSPVAANLFSGYALFVDGSDASGYYENGQGSMGGTPWEFRARYMENSPFFFFDRVTTPLLVEYGRNDVLSNGETFVGLRRLGKEVEFVAYDDEGHTLNNPANIVDFWQRSLEWLGEHLGVDRSP